MEDVVQHGSAEHVAAEINAQLTRARQMGFEPTHFDSHMGTLFATGRYIWDQGLPVLDDLHNSSYGWARAEIVERYVDAIVNLKPGVTMMIMHCSTESENIVLTTWRELMLRRQAVNP